MGLVLSLRVAFSTILFASATVCEGPEADSEALGSDRPREGFVYHSRAMPSQTALIHAVNKNNSSL